MEIGNVISHTKAGLPPLSADQVREGREKGEKRRKEEEREREEKEFVIFDTNTQEMRMEYDQMFPGVTGEDLRFVVVVAIVHVVDWCFC